MKRAVTGRDMSDIKSLPRDMAESDTLTASFKVNPQADLQARDVQAEALKAADSLLWSYDLSYGRLEFRGDMRALDLPPVHGPVALDDLAPLFEKGEIGRLESVLHAVEVHTAIDLPTDGHVQCLLRLKDQRLVYFKGRKVAKSVILGTLTELSRDIRRIKSTMDSGLGVHDVNHDPLTGLYNRQGFLGAAAHLLAREGDYDLVVGDLNRFRRLNEALGHDRADVVLNLLAERLRDAFGDHSVLARLGEDEFAVLTLRGFPRVSERMRNALERTLTVAGFDIHPTFSMGAVSVEGGEAALESAELLRRAEMAVEGRQAEGGRRCRIVQARSGKRRLDAPGAGGRTAQGLYQR